MRVGGRCHSPIALPAEKRRVIHLQEPGWAPGRIWTGAENLGPPPGFRSPDRPVRSESLYRLSYPDRTTFVHLTLI